jgi:hypothetical protein
MPFLISGGAQDRAGHMRDKTMPAFTRTLSRFSETHFDIDALKAIGLFCGAGLTVSLVMASI